MSDNNEPNNNDRDPPSESKDDDLLADNLETLNEDLWLRIKANDPTATSFILTGKEIFPRGIDWENEAHYIGSNTNVKLMMLGELSEGEEEENDDDDDGSHHRVMQMFQHFCKGLAKNTSIECVSLFDCDLTVGADGWLTWLGPFFENNCNIRRFDIIQCRVEAEAAGIIASTLLRMNKFSLKQFQITNTRMGASGRLIAEALKHHDNLEKLCLYNSGVGEYGSNELANLLQSPMCKMTLLKLANENVGVLGVKALGDALVKNKSLSTMALTENCPFITIPRWHDFFACLQCQGSALRELDLTDSNIDDGGLIELGNSLANNTTIRVLKLSENTTVTNIGWRAFLSCLQNSSSTLHTLILEQDEHIENEEASELAKIISGNTTLKKLVLDRNYGIGTEGWSSFFSVLPESGLEELHLGSNSISDEAASALGSGLAGSTSLKYLDIGSNSLVSSIGWQNFFTALQNSRSALEELDLYDSRIDDDALAGLVSALGNMSSLETLNIGRTVYVSVEGLISFAGLLQMPNCNLTKLCIHHNYIDDDVVIAFANNLRGNDKLRVLHLDTDDDGDDITEMGWAALSNLLCDESSIDSTYSSNHTLEELFLEPKPSQLSLPHGLSFLLHLNKNNLNPEAARQKILLYHFLDDSDDVDGINVDEFIAMELPVLPSALSWMGRGGYGFALMHRLLQTMPSLFGCSGTKVNNTGLKRKRI